MSGIDPAALIAAASAQTGLSDFGGDSFREGLGVYCQSVSTEAQLNPLGQMVLPAAILAALTNRLRVTDWLNNHSEIAAERIEAPFVVVGLFRAGTTFLSYLLEKDPGNRPLLRWEAGASVPPPDPATLLTDPRIEVARAGAAMMDQINPRIRIVQNEEPDGPTECVSVLNQDFRSLVWEVMANVPAYGAWQHQADHASSYAYHKKILQLLQSGGVRGRWSLKSPHHALHLDALTRTYPDARLVLMHRDPVVLCASVCSLVTTLTRTFSDADHRSYIAAHWTDMLARSIASVDAFRAAHPECKILDIHYAELVGDPIATMKRVYSFFGDTLDGPALQAMEAHIASRPKGRFGHHGYNPAEFGLDTGAIAERFSDYVQRYDIPREVLGKG